MTADVIDGHAIDTSMFGRANGVTASGIGHSWARGRVCKYTFFTRFQEIYDQEKKIIDCAEDIRLCPQQPSHQGWIVHRRRRPRLHMEAELTRRHRALEALTLVVRDDNPVVIPPDFPFPEDTANRHSAPQIFPRVSETGKWQIGASANPMPHGDCGLRREPI